MSVCCLCHRRVLLLGRNKVLDGAVCADCIRGLGLPELVDVPGNPRKNFADVAANFRQVPANAIPVVVQGIMEGAIFGSWYSVGECAQFDDRRREARLRNGDAGFAAAPLQAVAYADIADFQLLEEGGSITRGQFVGAFAGQQLFGGWQGAALGSMLGSYDQAFCRYIIVEVYLRNPEAAPVRIVLLRGKTKCDSATFRAAVEDTERLMWELDSIIALNG